MFQYLNMIRVHKVHRER